MALLGRLAAPRDGRPLLAAEPCGRRIAVSSCGLVVHALRGTERVASWRLPSRALRLLWCDSAASNPEGTAALAAVAEDGRCWWLELPTAAAASSGTVKRMRAGGRSAAVVEVGDAQRITPLPEVGALSAAVAVGQRGVLVFPAPATVGGQTPLPLLLSLPASPRAALAAPVPPAARPPALPALSGAAGAGCVLCLHAATTRDGGADGSPTAPKPTEARAAAALVHALSGTGRTAVALLDANGELRCAPLRCECPPPGPAAGSAAALPPPPLGRLHGPPARLLLAGGSAPAEAADTLVALSRTGRLLLLSAAANGAPHARLWQLDAHPHNAVVVGARRRTLVLLCADSLYRVRLPAALEAAPRAEAAAAAALRGAPPDEAPALHLSALCLAPPALLALPLPPAAPATPSAAVRAELSPLVALGVDGGVRRWTVEEEVEPSTPPPAPAEEAAVGAERAEQAAEAFRGAFVEQTIRRLLERIAHNADQLGTQQQALRRAEERLHAVGAAIDLVAALGATDAPPLCVPHVAAATGEVELEVTNPTAQSLADGWRIVAVLVQTPAASCWSASLAGLRARQSWRFSSPLALRGAAGDAQLLLLLFYAPLGPESAPDADTERVAWEASGAGGLCFPLGAHALLPLRRLHARGGRAGDGSLEAGGALLLPPPALAAALGRRAGPQAAGSAAEPGPAAVEGHVRLRVLLLANGCASRAAAALLASLITPPPGGWGAGGGTSGRRRRAGAAAAAATGGERADSAAVELPDGTPVSLRVAPDNEADGGAAHSMQLLLQCARPDALWRLRAALLRALAPPALPSTVAAAAEEEAAAVAAAAVAAAAAAAAEREVAALAAAMSAAKLEVLRLQERAYTLAQQRRLFDSGGAVSLAQLSREVRAACRAAADEHAALRGRIGCVSLAQS